jgi:hypothetical protein
VTLQKIGDKPGTAVVPPGPGFPGGRPHMANYMPMSQGAKRTRFHAQPKQPENLNNLYASYQGIYGKMYQPSFNGTFRSRSTATGTAFKSQTTREDHNQQGKDAQYDEVIADVHSPVKFELMRSRDIFHRRDGCMVSNANDNRFVAFNDLPTVNTKYKIYQSPGFHNWAEHGLDEFLHMHCCTEDDNIHQ